MMTRGDVMGAASPVVPPLSVLLLPVPAPAPIDTESPENTKSQCTYLLCTAGYYSCSEI